MSSLGDDTVIVLTHFLLDSALKGGAVLVTTIFAALLLRRNSSAAKHHVWLLGMVALVIAPVLSAALPKWKVLPPWTSVSTTVAEMPVITSPMITSPITTESASGAEDFKEGLARTDVILPSVAASSIPKAAGDSFVMPGSYANSQSYALEGGGTTSGLDVVFAVWGIGCSVLLLRLLAAWFVLMREEHRANVIWPKNSRSNTSTDRLVAAMHSAAAQLGITRPIRLLVANRKAIPLVWGLFRIRVLLPAEAVHWPLEQLRSVLLHELAHVQRGDIASQLLAQLACTLHWFNPLVWIAAWRLAAEREPACDDLVLESGVRPSTYAAHLLEITTGYTASPMSKPFSLAMARQSSIEGRLIAVLSGKRNRRAISSAIAAATLLISIVLVVPIAMLQANEETTTAGTQPIREQTDWDMMSFGSGMLDSWPRWGAPVGGLRAAVAVERGPLYAEKGSDWQVYLAVENCTDAPIRLCDNDQSRARWFLHIKLDGQIKTELTSEDRGTHDIVLAPRTITYLRLFESDQQANDGRTLDLLIGETLGGHGRSLGAELRIESAPESAWKGRLVTGEATGMDLFSGIATKSPMNVSRPWQPEEAAAAPN